ncbi:MAG: hypothetical protein WBW04_02615 [Nitrolancea sp.]
MADEQIEQTATEEAKPVLSQAARREKLGELAQAIGALASVEGDKVIVESGEAVALYYYIQPDGTIQMIRWMTANNPNGHPRWREAAEVVVQPGEAIYTSALGGGFLIEVERIAETVDAAVAMGKDASSIERVQQLVAEFPEAIALLDPEDVPDYLLPQENPAES